MAFPDDPLDVSVELRLSGVWTDITQYVYLRNPMTITWGRQDEGTRADSSKCPMTINNRDGRFSPKNPTGPYYGILGRNTAVRVSVTLAGGAVSYRFTGEVSAWPQRWDLSGNDRWVSVEASGIMRRLGQGASPLRDSLRRHIEANSPLAYWPLTDGESARQGSEVATGAQPMRAVGVAGSFYQGQPGWGQGGLAQWHTPVVQLPRSTEGKMTANVAPQDVPSRAFECFRSGIGGEDDITAFDDGDGTAGDPLTIWLCIMRAATDEVSLSRISFTDDTSSSTVLTVIANSGIFDLSPHQVRIATAANGVSTDWQVIIDGVVAASGTHAVPHKPISRIRYRWGAFGGADTDPTNLGHITLWGPAPDPADTYQALLGHARELAGRRIERLCAEQGVPLQVHGNLDDTPAMGPQRPATFLDVLRAAEDVDGGVLSEARNELALAYRTCASKYNQI